MRGRGSRRIVRRSWSSPRRIRQGANSPDRRMDLKSAESMLRQWRATPAGSCRSRARRRCRRSEGQRSPCTETLSASLLPVCNNNCDPETRTIARESRSHTYHRWFDHPPVPGCAIRDSLPGRHRSSCLVPVTNRLRLQQLTLQIERAVMARANLSVLLAASDASLVRRRHELRTLRARIRRDSAPRATSHTTPGPGRTP